MIIRYLSLIALVIGLTIAPCGADGTRWPVSRRVCVSGPRRPHVRLCLRKNSGGKAGHADRQGLEERLRVPKETFSNENEEFQNGVKTSTRLQAAKPPPKDAMMIAVLADAKDINELPLQEFRMKLLSKE